MQMQKTMVYLPKELKDRVLIEARSQGTSQAEVIREALEEGLNVKRLQGNASVEALMKIGELGKKYHTERYSKTNALEEIDKMWQGK